MKRFHVHVSVDNLAASVRFYSTVFGTSPTVLKDDYAKWMVDDPRQLRDIAARNKIRAGSSRLASRVGRRAD